MFYSVWLLYYYYYYYVYLFRIILQVHTRERDKRPGFDGVQIQLF